MAGTLALLALAVPAAGQERTLSWRALEVRARLDGDGRLHVRERHVLVFDGDWNGGERTFRIDLGQHLDFGGLRREVPGAGGRPVLRDLVAGDLDEVDHYDWTDSRTLHWRSRLPSDPPFHHREIAYDLDYVLSGVLQPEGEDGRSFLLDHDFAFPDREWPIERFTLDLELDPVWRPQRRFEGHLEAGPIPPGEGLVLTLPLGYAGSGRPAGVTLGAPTAVRLALGLGLLLLLPVPVVLLVRRERRSGRLGPPPVPARIDEKWLEENVFSMKPEVAGAVWDEKTGAAEVAAVLARMEMEGKLSSRVEGRKGLFSRPELHLRLRVPLDELEGYEWKLANSLFFGAEETSTRRVRERYKKIGFDPVGDISAVTAKARKLGGTRGRPRRQPRWPALVLSLAGAALLGLGIGRSTFDLIVAILTVAPGFFLYLWALSGAGSWRDRVYRVGISSLAWAIPLALLAAAALVETALTSLLLGSATLAGYALLCLAAWVSVCHRGSTRQSPQRIALRRRLVAAREHFARQLAKPEPKLSDAWIPWLVALGLGGTLDRWTVAHRGSSAGSLGSTAGAVAGSAFSGGSGGGFTGGGGSFGGAGATAAWASAAAGMAAGVAAPSSSSGGGGGFSGGGGSSSGGGGGGGW